MSPHPCSVSHFNQLLCFPVGLLRRRKVKRSGNTVLHLQRHHQVQRQTVHATERSAKESTDIRNMNLWDQQIHHPAPVTRGKRRRRRKSTIVSRPKKTRNTRKKRGGQNTPHHIHQTRDHHLHHKGKNILLLF